MISSLHGTSLSSRSLICSNANPNDPKDLCKHPINSNKRYDPLNKSNVICSLCYYKVIKKRWNDTMSSRKLVCSRAGNDNFKHNMARFPKRFDPLDRTKQICNSCYLRIYKEIPKETCSSTKKLRQCSNIIDETKFSHTSTDSTYLRNPLDRTKKVCKACYSRLLYNKKKQDGLGKKKTQDQ